LINTFIGRLPPKDKFKINKSFEKTGGWFLKKPTTEAAAGNWRMGGVEPKFLVEAVALAPAACGGA